METIHLIRHTLVHILYSSNVCVTSKLSLNNSRNSCVEVSSQAAHCFGSYSDYGLCFGFGYRFI